MRNGEICLIKTGLVAGRQWSESNYCVGFFYNDEYYAVEALSGVFREVGANQWMITEYVESVMSANDFVLLDDETIEYLEDGI